MKEEIKRITTLVQEGKLSPEDAAELIEAFASSSEETRASSETSGEAPPEGPQTPPPPPEDANRPKDPFQGFFDTLEGIGRDISRNVNWKEVAESVKSGAKKAGEALKDVTEQAKFGRGFHWFTTKEERTISLPIVVPAGKTLRIDGKCGDIKVTGNAASSTVTAHATISGRDAEEAKAKAETFNLVIEESDSFVLIRQPEMAGLDVDLDIQLSNPASVEIKSTAGGVEVAGTGGPCRVQARSGDVNLSGLDGVIDVTLDSGDLTIRVANTPSLTIEGKSGDVLVEEVNGNMNIRTSSGDVEVRRCTGRTVAVEAVSGDVSVDLLTAVDGTLTARTVHGDAEVYVADGSNARVTLATLRGDAVCELELQEESKRDQHITGRLGAGMGTIDVSAVNGNVSLELRDSMS